MAVGVLIAAIAALILLDHWTGILASAAIGGASLALGLVTHRSTRVPRSRSPRAELKSPPRVSVVVPALNEAGNLRQVLRGLPRGLHEVILVDGGSSDWTVEVAEATLPSIRVLHQSGRGKGDALRQGFEAVTGDVVVTIDADRSMDPGEIPQFVQHLLDGADFAKGSRCIDGGGSDDFTMIRRLGNWALSKTANLLFNSHYTDINYGYSAFWTYCLPYIDVDVPGFEVETLVSVRVARAGLVVSEVPSFESLRPHGESHLRPLRDGMRVMRTILRESRLNPRMWQPRPEPAIAPLSAHAEQRNPTH